MGKSEMERRSEQSSKDHSPKKAVTIGAFAVAAIQVAIPMLGIPVNMPIGCLILAIAIVLSSWALWLWCSRWGRLAGVVAILSPLFLGLWLFGPHIVKQWRATNTSMPPAPPPSAVALAPLATQTKPIEHQRSAPKQSKLHPSAVAPDKNTAHIGNDNTLVNVPAQQSMGDGNTIVGPTDSHGNTVYNKGGVAIGNGARADSTSVAIGAHANAGNTTEQPSVGTITVQPGAAVSVGQKGGITVGQINLLKEDQSPIALTYSQETGSNIPPYTSTVTVSTSRRIDATTLVLVFDSDVDLPSSIPVGSCMTCGMGRINDSSGHPDNHTIWIFWMSPPFIPERPLRVPVSSSAPAKLIKVSRGPQLPG